MGTLPWAAGRRWLLARLPPRGPWRTKACQQSGLFGAVICPRSAAKHVRDACVRAHARPCLAWRAGVFCVHSASRRARGVAALPPPRMREALGSASCQGVLHQGRQKPKRRTSASVGGAACGAPRALAGGRARHLPASWQPSLEPERSANSRRPHISSSCGGILQATLVRRTSGRPRSLPPLPEVAANARKPRWPDVKAPKAQRSKGLRPAPESGPSAPHAGEGTSRPAIAD
jgi:hypothetical protein